MVSWWWAVDTCHVTFTGRAL